MALLEDERMEFKVARDNEEVRWQIEHEKLQKAEQKQVKELVA